jgi:hypothetical protein
MAFIDLAEAIGNASESSASRALLGPAISAGIDEGLSGRAMLAGIRSSGAAIRDSAFYQLVGEVRASKAMTAAWGQAPLDQIPSDELIQEWHGGATDTYLNRVYMYVRTNVDGEMAIERRGVSIMTKELISPSDALGMAQDLYDENADNENYANEQFLGSEFGGVYHQLGTG